MADTQFLLGKLIEGNPSRDAVHIAVAPMIAGTNLLRGEQVGISGDEAHSGLSPFVGIVDPFLTVTVLKGQKFWLYLFPNTITSLHHLWTHPAFAAEGADNRSASEKWIAEWAAELDQTPSKLMRAAEQWARDGEWTYDNSESYKSADYSKWPEFWKHYEIVTGEKVADHEATVFTCSC